MNINAFFSAFGIICLVSVLIYKTYELNIKVFLYYHGITFVKEELLDQDKVFDAFISFSHEDDEFVIKDIVTGKMFFKTPRIYALHDFA